MSREHDVCFVASWAGRDTDSEPGGVAVALKGTTVPCAVVPLGKRLGTTPLPMPWLWVFSTHWSNLKA